MHEAETHSGTDVELRVPLNQHARARFGRCSGCAKTLTAGEATARAIITLLDGEGLEVRSELQVVSCEACLSTHAFKIQICEIDGPEDPGGFELR